MEPTKRSPEYITVSKIAEMLDVSYSTARELVISKIPHIKIGSRYRIREEEFRKYLKKREREA